MFNRRTQLTVVPFAIQHHFWCRVGGVHKFCVTYLRANPTFPLFQNPVRGYNDNQKQLRFVGIETGFYHFYHCTRNIHTTHGADMLLCAMSRIDAMLWCGYKAI